LNENIAYGTYALTDGDAKRGRHAGLAAHIIERLPLFSNATVPEILEVRRELQEPLRRFRAGIARFSEQIKPAVWDADFTTEADILFVQEVEVAVLEIAEAVRSNNPLRLLADKTFTKGGGVFTGAEITLGGLVTRIGDLPGAITASALAGLSLAGTFGIARTAYQTYDDWQKKRREIRGNQFYFLVETARRLSRT
jgi:hypothetical protein